MIYSRCLIRALHIRSGGIPPPELDWACDGDGDQREEDDVNDGLGEHGGRTDEITLSDRSWLEKANGNQGT